MKRLALVLLFLISCAAWLGAQEKTAAPGDSGSKTEGKPEESDLVWRWANFVLFAAGLGYLLAKNLPPYFRSRTEEIQKGISEAQQMKRDAEKRAAEMEEHLKMLGEDIEKFREQAHSEMEQEGARIRQETARQIDRLRQQAEQEIEAASKTARRELKGYAADLALNLAEQRIRRRLDGKAEAGLVDDFVKDLQRQGSKN